MLRRTILAGAVALFFISTPLPTAYASTPPTVVTGSVSSIGQEIAYASGQVTNPGSASVVYEGITWDTTHGSTYGDYTYATHTSDPSTTPFTLPLYGLTCGTTYYYRAYAQNDHVGPYSVGDEESFSTLSCVPAPSIALGDSLYSGVFGPDTWNPSVDWDTSDTCEYSYDSIDYYSVNCAAGGTDIPPPDTDGSPTIFLRGSNGSGSSEIATGFIYDSVAPSVSIATPVSGATIHESEWMPPQVDWGDAFTCEYSYDDVNFYDAGCGYDTSASPPEFGATTVYVRGIDEAGNVGTDSISYTYAADVYGCMDPSASNYNADANIDDECTYPDLIAPNISIGSPYEGEFVGAFSPSVEWDDAVSCRYTYDSGDPTYIPCNNDGGIAPPDTSGEHTLTVYGDDDSANEGSASVTFTYSPEPLFAEDSGAVSDITADSAIIGYSLATQGATSVSVIEVLYDTDAAYTANAGEYGHTLHYDGSFADSGAMDIHELACNTEYHFAFVAYNDDYDTTSSDNTFITGSCPPAMVSITWPTDGSSLHVWSPMIDWDTATMCEYAIDEDPWDTLACGSDEDIPAPSEGVRTLHVRGSSDDGATWSEASATFTFDTTAPTVVITAPTESATVAAGDFAAVVDWGDSEDCSYSYDDFGNTFSTDCSTDGADIPAPIGGGEVTLSVRGNDAAGNRTETSITFTMEEDLEAPTVSLTAPLDGSTYLKGDLVGLTADADDDAGIAEVRFYVNGVAIYPDTSAPYSFDWNTSATSTGPKTVVAVAKDTSGNYATSSPATFDLIDFEGAGTTGDPYQIEECFQFPTMNEYLGAAYKLMNDLNCSELEDSVMVGTPDAPFTGSFDGDGHILGILMSDIEDDEIGLFRETDGASIRDINLIAQISGGTMTGSLVGLAQDTTIINASSTALVVGLGDFASPPFVGTGGIVGAMVGGSILGSHFYGQMLGYLAVGGIVGTASSDALISRSWSSGEIYGGAGIGGIVGYLIDDSQVRNSYNDASVVFYEPLRDGLPVSGAFGGIAGIIVNGTISRSYSSGDVGGDGLVYPSGGIAGVSQGNLTIAYSFSLSSVAGGDTGAAGFFGGSLGGGTTTLVGNVFDPGAAGTDVCRLDAPEDSTGCSNIDTASDPGYWVNAAHAPLDHFNTADVWNLAEGGPLPVLRAYLSPEAAESDEADAEPGPDESDSESTPTPAPVTYGGGGAAGLFGTIGTLKGFGYIAPRPQIIFPDGHIVYLDQHTDAPPSVNAPVAEASSYAFTRSLKLGMSGEDVRQLQKYLNTHGFIIAKTGPGSPGNETTYFGALTKSALIRFQEAHAAEILTPVGLTAGTGLFGPSTIAYLSRSH